MAALNGSWMACSSAVHARYDRKWHMRIGILALLFALLIAGGTPAFAANRGDRDRARASDVMPLDQILPQIRSSHPGRFYDADGPFPDGHGGLHYRLKWMTPQGRIIWLETDARTGRVVGRGRDVNRAQRPSRGDYENSRRRPAQAEPDGNRFRGRDRNRDRDYGNHYRKRDDGARERPRYRRGGFKRGREWRGNRGNRERGSYRERRGRSNDRPHRRGRDGGGHF